MSPLDWAQQNPVLTCLLAFWVMCMATSWPWFAPTLALAVVIGTVARGARRRRQRLAADADRQHAQALAGDPRGIYGNYPPPAIEGETDGRC